MEYAHIVAAVAERNTLFRTDADMLRQLQQCIALVGSPQGYVCKSRIPAGRYAVGHGRKNQPLVLHTEEWRKLKDRLVQQWFYGLVDVDVGDP